MSETIVYLVRHAESAPNARVPESDWPLSETGEQQAQALVPQLARLNIDHIITSPYRRAMATIEPFARIAKLPIATEFDLRERKLTEATHDDWLALLKRVWDNPTHAEPNSESNVDCQTRVLACLTRLARTHSGRTIVAASHGNAISLMLNTVDPTFGFNDWRAMRNPDCFALRYSQSRWHWLREFRLD